ncbi:MAG TPA: alpha/beta hydrolase [Steroidobacteraceae bacterium]|nr:alpha/beta hydrolase [Steroidobacteraceae bacterium]
MSEVWKRLRELGDTFTMAEIGATRELFVPGVLQPQAVGAAVTRDLSYGPDARHRLDIFAPAAARSLPVVLFVHGGGFVGGDKGSEGDPFFNNVGAWAVRSGFIGVTMTYRLAPGHMWPAGAQDVDRALAWLHAQIARYGGDASRIVLMGHSAGAAHVAACLARHGCIHGTRASAAAAIFVSGIYALDVYPDGYDYQVYYGADRRLDAERSTVSALAKLDIPSLFTISEFDPVPFHRHLAAVFTARVQARGRCPAVLWQRGHNHVSVMMQIGSELDTAGNELADFIRQLQSSAP